MKHYWWKFFLRPEDNRIFFVCLQNKNGGRPITIVPRELFIKPNHYYLHWKTAPYFND